MHRQTSGARLPSARLAEISGLARAIDLSVVGEAQVSTTAIRPATYLGKGKVEDIAALLAAEEVSLAIVDAPLTPVQQRNLETAWKVKVLDRTGLILEIFGRRAKTREGVLQVELAHLNYQKSRLVRSWTHLERQRGGFGFLGGPGESQIEADRRQIQERIGKIEHELLRVKRTRGLHRQARQRVPYPVVSLVGYTNAGKSTLFNRLTQSDVLAADMLFATLDPTMRAVVLPHGMKIMISDTVGFISELPTQLIAAFRATLEEVLSADVIVHVRDISHDDTDAQAADVQSVLHELGIDHDVDDRTIEVWNKIDLLDDENRTRLFEQSARKSGRRSILVSAARGEGIDDLLHAIEHRITHDRPILDLRIPSTEGATLGWLHENTEVLARQDDGNGNTDLTIRTSRSSMDYIRTKYGMYNSGSIE